MNAIHKTLVLAASLLLLTSLAARVAPADTLPMTEVTASGLALHWQSQIQADSTRDGVADLFLHVHDDRATSYYEIRYEGVRETIGFDDVSPRGTPFGKEGAAEFAQLRKEILEAEGWKDVSVELITTPQTTIYSLSGFGEIHAIDAETGRTRWKNMVGKAFQPSVGVAANNRWVIALKGSRLYALNAETGNVEWSRLARYAPGGGVSISEHFAYVTSVTGKLQMFPLESRGLPEKFFASSGPATMDPTVSANTVSWATERGFFNVASSDESGRFLYRLLTNEKFLAPGTQVGDYLIAVSVYGKVYAIHEKDGILGWEIALGEPVANQPVYIGDNRIAIITTLNNLMILDTKRGQLVNQWPRSVPGIDQYVGGSSEVLYFLDMAGRLVGLSRETGSQLMQTAVGDDMRVLANNETDRMYLTDRTGRIACLRELANVNPVIHGEDPLAGPADAAENPFGTDEPDAAGKDEDKYGKLSDPFGEEPQTGGDPDDPFGNDAMDKPDDPFGDDSGSDPDDPFADESSDDESGDMPESDPDDPFGDDSGSDPDDPFADDSSDDSGDDDSGDDDSGDDDSGDDSSSDDSDPDDPFGDG